VEVTTDIVIERPRTDVAAYAADPNNARAWYENIVAVRWKSPEPLAVGTRVEYTARFLGRGMTYTYEVRELVAGERLVLGTADGPFPMETTYVWKELEDGSTRMSLTNRGGPSGPLAVLSPLMAAAVRRANHKDLRRLKAILES
jgi:hypothetical protein